MQIFKYIKAERFFPDFLPHVKSYKHKIRGKNGRGNPVTFTPDELKAIKKGLQMMVNKSI